jgi:PAS domain S-box-containing protein
MQGEAPGGDAGRIIRGARVLSTAMTEFADATSDYARLVQAVARNVASGIGDTCIVLLLSADKGRLELVAVDDADPRVAGDFSALLASGTSVDESTYARDVMLTGEPVCIAPVDLDALARRASAEAIALHRRIGTRGLLVVPLRVRGEHLGNLSIVRHRAGPAPLDALDVEIARDLANHAALAIANARLMQDAQRELALRRAAEIALDESERLRRAEQESLRANRFLDAIVENIPDMIFVKDAERLSFTRFNRAGELLLGIPRSELVGKTDRDFFPQEQADFFQDKDRQTLSGGLLVDIPEEAIETRHGTRWLHTKKVPVVDIDGTPLFLLGISQDITERKLADEELRLAKEAMQAANRELEAFSYSVAHDLRAPLRAMDGFSHALLEDYGDKLDAEGVDFLRRVRTAAQDMAALIDGLLGLARVARTELVRESVDLSEVARRCGARLREANAEREVELVVQDGLVIDGDAALLAVAMQNLLGNAWKYTSKRAHARIEVGRVETGGDAGHLFVRDNGAGFDMRYAKKLFQPFQRLHGAAEFEGSGIGLATVHRIVERHGGRIWAESEVDRGATFCFVL